MPIQTGAMAARSATPWMASSTSRLRPAGQARSRSSAAWRRPIAPLAHPRVQAGWNRDSFRPFRRCRRYMPPAQTASKEVVARGAQLYGATCRLCHGLGCSLRWHDTGPALHARGDAQGVQADRAVRRAREGRHGAVRRHVQRAGCGRHSRVHHRSRDRGARMEAADETHGRRKGDARWPAAARRIRKPWSCSCAMARRWTPSASSTRTTSRACPARRTCSCEKYYKQPGDRYDVIYSLFDLDSDEIIEVPRITRELLPPAGWRGSGQLADARHEAGAAAHQPGRRELARGASASRF